VECKPKELLEGGSITYLPVGGFERDMVYLDKYPIGLSIMHMDIIFQRGGKLVIMLPKIY
jgi:hypothetical protein